jgi:hypothetical protein
MISESNGKTITSAMLDTNRDAKLNEIEAAMQRSKISHGLALP